MPLELIAIDLATIPDMPIVPAASSDDVGTWAATEVGNQDQSINQALGQPAKTIVGAEPPRAEEWLQGIQQPLLRYATQQRLSLFDALIQAISYAPEIDVVRTELGIREQEIERQRGAFNWTQFVETNWDELNQPVASSLDGVSQRLEQHTLNSTGGVRKLNAAGGQASLSQDMGFRDSNSSFFNPNNQALSRIALEYRQPLLRGAGRSVNLGQIQIATTDANIGYEQLVGTMQRHLGQVRRPIGNWCDCAATMRFNVRTIDESSISQRFCATDRTWISDQFAWRVSKALLPPARPICCVPNTQWSALRINCFD